MSIVIKNPETGDKLPSTIHSDDPKTQKKLDEKTTYELLVAETRRQIKQGYNKNAFLQADKYLTANPNINSVWKIRLCRRLLSSLTKICNGYLYKGEIQRMDHFLKLMDKANSYLTIWHDSLGTYIVNTNKKFSHLEGVLIDISDSLSETHLNHINKKNKNTSISREPINTSNINNLSLKSPTVLESMIKNQTDLNSHDKDNLLNNTFHLNKGEKVIVEQFNGTELNSKFSVDEFFKYFILHNLNWALLMKKIKKFNAAFRFLSVCYHATQELSQSLNPSLIHVCAKARISLALFYSELGKEKEALEMYESTIILLQAEVNIRVNKYTRKTNDFLFQYQFKLCIEKIVLVFINMAVLYDLQDSYQRVIESYRNGQWFANKFLETDSELYKVTEKLALDAKRKYEKYLKELGELERLANGSSKSFVNMDDRKSTGKNNFLTDYVKTKFNFEAFNSSQFILLRTETNLQSTKSNGSKSSRMNYFGTTSDSINYNHEENKTETSQIQKSCPSPRKENEQSMSKFVETELPTSHNKIKKKRSIKKTLKHQLVEEEPKLLTSDKYFKNIDPEQEVQKLELSPENEVKIIEMLNRNIKYNKQKNPNKKIEGYIDVDNYFFNLIEKKITEKEQDIKNPPKKFNDIIKRHYYHLANEDFDKKEFDFCQKMLIMKNKEGVDQQKLGGYKSTMPTISTMAEESDFINEAHFIQTRSKMENQLIHGNMKFPTKLVPRSTKSQTDIATPESHPFTSSNVVEKPKEKLKLSTILLQHKDTIELKTVSNVLKERAKKQRQIVSPTIKSPETDDANCNLMERYQEDDQCDEKTLAKRKILSQRTKDMIQLMMEGLEKEIQREDKSQKLLSKGIKVLPPTEKIKESKFLKDQNDLAKSTANISIRRDASRKIWNFAELVKINSKMMKNLKTNTQASTESNSHRKLN